MHVQEQMFLLLQTITHLFTVQIKLIYLTALFQYDVFVGRELPICS